MVCVLCASAPSASILVIIPCLCYGVMGVCERLKHGSLSVKYAKRDKTRANTLNYVRFALTLQENSR